MLIGGLISFCVFGGTAYWLGKLSLNHGLDKDNRALAAFFYFLTPMMLLSLISVLIVVAYGFMGFSVSVAAEALARSLNYNSSGLLVLVGTVLTAIVGIAAIGAGPATAFTASQVSTVITAILLVASPDRGIAKKWAPWVAFAVYGFCMWPFAAMLTFGL